MSEDTDEQAAAADARPADSAHADTAAFAAVFASGAGLFDALRRVVTGLLALLAAEARVLRASVAWVLLGGVALVALAVSLWACVVALAGWALFVASGSAGIALAILVLLHVLLVGALGLWLKRVIRHASFPETRGELRALGAGLRRQAARYQQAAPPPAPEETP